MNNKIQAIRGMNDLLPKDSSLWLSVERIISNLFISYGFKNIRTPIVEKTDTFVVPLVRRLTLLKKKCTLGKSLTAKA